MLRKLAATPLRYPASSLWLVYCAAVGATWWR